MGTRSAIAVKHGNVIKAVYCHWDGYLDHNGRILFEHYDSPKANHLISLGDISSLRQEIGEKHPFSCFDVQMTSERYNELYGDMTVFYHRDRGEDKDRCDYKVFDSYEAFYDYFSDCDYFYLMENGNWSYSTKDDSSLRTLADEFALLNGTE